MNNTLVKNNDYIVEIQNYGHSGEGVGRIENIPVFIQDAIVGETVKVKIVKVAKTHAFGKIIEVIEKSQERVTPVCEIYNRCGGCNLQHMSYKEQLNLKKNRVKDCVERIGKVKDAVIHDTLGMSVPYRYRNKVQLPIGIKNGEVNIGFYAARSHDIINMNECHIQDEVADKVMKLTREWIKKFNITTYNVDGKENVGLLRHLMIRRGFKTNEVMVVLVTKERKIPYINELIETLVQNIDGLKSVIQNVNNKVTNVILGLENITLWGSDTISDYIGEFKFNISPLSFFQVNPIQTEVLYNKALEYANLSGNEVVFDAYCGTGTISLFLSKKAKKVYGVEIIESAIENAKINAKQNNIDNAEFFVGEAEVVIPNLINDGIKADVVVVDPPRKGCDKALLDSILKMSPDRIVYVSCDPSTLSRDLEILEQGSYKVKEVQPVDMFPSTAHCEVVCLLQRTER